MSIGKSIVLLIYLGHHWYPISLQLLSLTVDYIHCSLLFQGVLRLIQDGIIEIGRRDGIVIFQDGATRNDPNALGVRVCHSDAHDGGTSGDNEGQEGQGQVVLFALTCSGIKESTVKNKKGISPFVKTLSNFFSLYL